MQMISSSTSSYHLSTLFIVVLVLINHHQTSANSLNTRSAYQSYSPSYKSYSYDDIDERESPVFIDLNSFYPSDKEAVRSSNPWSQLLRRSSQRSSYVPGISLRRGTIRYISFPAEKRAIPIEFQKALFAHGIVGRRR